MKQGTILEISVRVREMEILSRVDAESVKISVPVFKTVQHGSEAIFMGDITGTLNVVTNTVHLDCVVDDPQNDFLNTLEFLGFDASALTDMIEQR